MKAKFIFLTNDKGGNGGKVKLYFQSEKGDVLEIVWANDDYIKNKLSAYKVKTVDDLSGALSKIPEHEVYMYSYTDHDGNKREGFTLDEPFPTASEPTKAIVAGKVKDVKDNGLKLAVIVDLGKGESFTVTRSYYVFNPDTKKSYPLETKRQNLLSAFGVDEFTDLKGKKITFIRQAAGSNYYYNPAVE